MTQSVFRTADGVRAHAPRANAFTAEKRAIFLAELAGHANVKLAYTTAGVSRACVYRTKARDAGFAAAWNDALLAGYETLEMLMLSHAIAQMTPPDPEAQTPAATGPALSERVLINLLALHRDEVRALRAAKQASVAGTPATAAPAAEDPRDQLEAVLAVMRERLTAPEEAGGKDGAA